MLRSAVFRVSLINAVLLVTALVGAFAGAWLTTRAGLEAAARDRIEIEAEALLSELGKEGVAGAAAAIDWRSRRPGSLRYLFVVRGAVVAGDMTAAPRVPGWHRFRQGSGRDILARTIRRTDGSVIAVGEDLGAGETIRTLLLHAMLPIMGIALALVVAISLIATARALRRMNEIVAVTQAIEQGDFSARVGVPENRGDDIDALGSAINRMLDRIDGLVTTVRRVSAEIAHDLRTPLTHTRHALQAAKWADNDVRRERCIDMANDSLAQALRSFDAMLRLAELDSGQVHAAFTPVAVGEIAERAFDAYRAELEASGRSIRLQRHVDCVVGGDGDLLFQATVNILDNTLKHTPVGTAITVRVESCDQGIALTVEDDGPGLTPDHFETMMRPFGRLDEARHTEGSGLGLAIANSIAKLHGGRIRLASLAPGLSVRLEIPCERCRAA